MLSTQLVAPSETLTLENAKAGGIPAQAGRESLLERWHIALALKCGAELRGRADALIRTRDAAKWRQAEPDSERANQWIDLAARITLAISPDPETPRPLFRARDVELIRWFKLVELDRRAPRPTRTELAHLRGQLELMFKAVMLELLPLELAAVYSVKARD